MNIRDPHRFSNELEHDVVQRIIARLESRAKDEVFTRLFDRYAQHIELDDSSRVLDLGCGTGVIARSLARKPNFSGRIVGVDQSEAFIEAARRFSADEQVGECVEFLVCDGHCLDLEDASFDVAIAHTLISHVSDPATVVQELARVVRPGGTVVIFDGDYSSLTYAVPDHEFGRRMDFALAHASFNNPHIMRDLVRMLPDYGFGVVTTLADVVSEIGTASYFASFADTYAPLVVSSGLMAQHELDHWLHLIERAKDDNTFFAACNYYAYILERF